MWQFSLKKTVENVVCQVLAILPCPVLTSYYGLPLGLPRSSLWRKLVSFPAQIPQNPTVEGPINSITETFETHNIFRIRVGLLWEILYDILYPFRCTIHTPFWTYKETFGKMKIMSKFMAWWKLWIYWTHFIFFKFCRQCMFSAVKITSIQPSWFHYAIKINHTFSLSFGIFLINLKLSYVEFFSIYAWPHFEI